MKLYEYDAALASCWDEETGEILNAELMDALEMERDQKIDNICSYIKDLQAEAAAIKEEKLQLARRQARAEKQADGLKRYLAMCMAGEKWKNARHTIGWRKSVQLIVDNVQAIMESGRDDLLVYADPTVNKTAAKEALAAGEAVPGVHLEEVNNIQIK